MSKPFDPQILAQLKGSLHLNELLQIYNYLFINMATVKMIEAAVEVRERKVCKYLKIWGKADANWEVGMKRCAKTGRYDWCLTTNPDNQPNFFYQLNLLLNGK